MWPTPDEYRAAVQVPAESFEDPEFRGARFRTMLGQPDWAEGQNAIVFVTEAADPRVLRCFLRAPDDGLRLRYKSVEQLWSEHSALDLARAWWLDGGVAIREQSFPVVKMEYIDGGALSSFVAERPSDTALRQIAEGWLALCVRLRQLHLAHGDLQSNNLLVVNGSQTRLVDFDGVWLPAVADIPPLEVGHRNFQHPERIESGHWSEHVDAFSALSIYLSLRALSVDRSLTEYCSDNRLVLGEPDYLAPNDTEVWYRLAASPEPEVRDLAALLAEFCQTTVEVATDLESLVSTLQLPSSRPRSLERESVAKSWEWWAEPRKDVPETAATEWWGSRGDLVEAPPVPISPPPSTERRLPAVMVAAGVAIALVVVVILVFVLTR